MEFTDGTLYVHGLDIGEEIQKSVDAWNNGYYNEVGYDLGVASYRLLRAANGLDNDDLDVTVDSPRKLYY